ncbi:MAG: alpha/beta fold hydrolase [Planctomycetota bacterium]
MSSAPHQRQHLYVRDTGVGQTVLFLHGFPLSHTMWDDAIERLAPAYRCIAPDLRGFGRSAPVHGPVMSMETYADDIARTLDRLDVTHAHVVGLSMGGYIALAFAERHAERLRTLTLVDTRAEAEDEAGRARRVQAATSLLEVGRAAFARDMITKLVAPGAALELRARLATLIEAAPYESTVAALMGMKVRPDRMHVLRELAVPYLVMCGELDALTPPELSRAMAAANGRSELALIPGAGHMSPMEQPDMFAARLAGFLERHA